MDPTALILPNATLFAESHHTPLIKIFIENSRNLPSDFENVTQAVLLIISALFTFVGARIALHLSVFHWNLRMIMVACLLIWVELALSRTLCFVFHFDYVYLKNQNDSLLSPCETDGSCNFWENWQTPLFLAAFFRYHYLFFMLQLPLCIVFERAFATVFVRDYERKRRRWVFFLISGLSNGFSTFMACLAVTSNLNFHQTIITVSFTMFLSALLYLYLSYHNLQQLFILENEHRRTNYSLSIRYQLKENVKTLKLMRQFFVTMSIFILAMSLSVYIPIITTSDADMCFDVFRRTMENR
ncbi:unnamed protein product [Caenorhabditis auriculariae]|uniref:Uncharacterized protein n=1 Tax=Caenorhabditis auriculariae TaxID=2777116 RepID=A0A8S1H9S5_9PELO|nr:unnamed protein product [Caenorhabditis auriculariae]